MFTSEREYGYVFDVGLPYARRMADRFCVQGVTQQANYQKSDAGEGSNASESSSGELDVCEGRTGRRQHSS